MTMRTILIILSLLFVHLTCFCQDTIQLTANKVTQLIFPTAIKSFKGGFIPNDFVMEQQENVLYIQPIIPFAESNLNVITRDNLYFTFIIRYADNPKKLNYIIPESAAFFGNQQKKAQLRDSSSTLESIRTTCNTILNHPGYLVSRNGARSKQTYMYIKGIYIHEDKLYFRFVFENKSHIKYDFEYIAFYIREKKQNKNTTRENIQLQPVYVHHPVISIQGKGIVESIYCFDKFTISDEKALYVDMIEKEGERNISLEIDNHLLLGEVRTIK